MFRPEISLISTDRRLDLSNFSEFPRIWKTTLFEAKGAEQRDERISGLLSSSRAVKT